MLFKNIMLTNLNLSYNTGKWYGIGKLLYGNQLWIILGRERERERERER